MRYRLWYGIEQFGADIVFNVGDSATKLNTLRDALIAVNSAMEVFTKQAALFNESVNKTANLSNLIKTIEQLLATQAKLGPSTGKGNKEAANANAIRKKLIGTILEQNKAYDEQNRLVKQQIKGLDSAAKKITIDADAEGKLLGVKTKEIFATHAQINAQKKLEAQVARATAQFAALTDLRNRGLLKNLQIIPRISTSNNRLIETWKGLDAQGKTFNATITRTNGRITNISGNLPTLDRSLQKTGKRLAEFTLSWKSMLRIIAAQAIRRVLFTFISQLKESITRATEFSIKIAEVRTISQQNQLSTEEWARGLRELSDSFGIDLLNQTEAAYQTLSNQVAHGAEVFGFLEQANRLALATVSDSATAVQFLTAIQNAYNFSLEETGKNAAKAFKIVELGRVRLNEMSQTIGQLAVPAKQLNIRFSELGAAVDTITKRGIPFNEAQTLLRNVMLSLIRPTDTMKGLIRELGFSSGEAMIAALGFGGALAEIEKRTKGSSTEIAKFFRRIRGTVGDMVFAGKGLKDYRENFKKIENAGKSFANAQKIIFQSAGKNIQVEVNKIKNFFTNDFGKDVVEVLSLVNRKLISLTTIVKTLASAFEIVLVPAIFLAIAATKTLKRALTSLNIAVVVASIIGGVLKVAIDSYTSSLEEAAKASEKFRLRQIEDAKKITDALVNNAFKSYDKIKTIALKAIAAIRSANFKLSDDQIALDKNIGKGIASAYGEVKKSLKAGLKGITDSIKEANKLADDAANRIVDLRRELERKLFEGVLGKIEDPTRQIEAIKARIKNLKLRTINVGVDKQAVDDARNAYKEIATLQTLIDNIQKGANKNSKRELELREKIKRADEDIAKVRRKQHSDELKALDKIRRASKSGEAVGITTKNGKTIVDTSNTRAQAADAARLQKQADSEQRIANLVKKRNDLVNQLTKTKKKEIGIGVKLFNIQSARLKLLKDQIKFEEELRIKAKKVTQEREAAAAIQRKNIADIQDAYVEVANITATGLVKEDDLKKQKKNIEDSLKSIKAFRETLAEKGAGLDEATRFRLEQKLADRRGQLNALLTANDNEQKLRGLDDQLKKRLEIIAKEKKALKTQGADAIARVEGVKNAITESVKTLLDRAVVPVTVKKDALKQLQSTFEDITATNIGALQDNLRKFERATGAIGATSLPSVDLIGKAIVSLHALQNKVVEAQKKTLEKGRESARTLKKIEAIQKKLGFSNVIKEELPKQTLTLVKILQELQKFNGTNPKTIGKAHGGQIGMDSIPAMLSPGEFVMNARSSKRFYSQLVAMNATPFARGGLVNNNVGDVNVSMQSSGNENYDVTKFGKLLRRQIRRGTLKLN